jgi:predicted pyridoxine 5'-phosphate oxidase superfamily flavin-nucleotide-binding protein
MNHSPFHDDELAAQELAGGGSAGSGIRDCMPEQRRSFFAGLSYLAVSTTDHSGWPIATLLTGAPGFVASPDANTLRIGLRPNESSPLIACLEPEQELGILGIDFATRRRNRANGGLTRRHARSFLVAVNQSFGNCSRYIQRRSVEPVTRAPATVEPLRALDNDARELVRASDTLFVASRSRPEIAGQRGEDISHRGGKPGFVRIAGDRLTVPEFPGNRYYNTLGNFLGFPRAALLFLDFDTGDLLHLQGDVEIDWGAAARAGFAGAEHAWHLHIAAAWWHRRAVLLGWSFVDHAPTTEETGAWDGTGINTHVGSPTHECVRQ